MLQTNTRTRLRLSHSPDPDDAFAWWGILTGRVPLPGFDIECSPLSVQKANEGCLREELDVAAISSAAYPLIADNYHLLSTGASVGRGYGPVLAALEGVTMDQLAGKTVGVPGNLTTGAMLLRLLVPGVRTVEYPFEKVAEAILTKQIDAGVLIHEELMNWEDKGLRRLACLGHEWLRQTGLPIPVGLIVVHRRLGEGNARLIASVLEESIRHGLTHPQEAGAWAMNYSIETHEGIGTRFIEMFTNDDSLGLKDDCIEALNQLYRRAEEVGLIEQAPEIDPVSPLTPVNSTRGVI